MKTILSVLSVCFIFLLVSCQHKCIGSSATEEELEGLLLHDLSQYSSSKESIWLKGRYEWGFERTALFGNYGLELRKNGFDAVWIEIAATSSVQWGQLEKLADKDMYLKGTIDFEDKGHLAQYLGTMYVESVCW